MVRIAVHHPQLVPIRDLGRVGRDQGVEFASTHHTIIGGWAGFLTLGGGLLVIASLLALAFFAIRRASRRFA